MLLLSQEQIPEGCPHAEVGLDQLNPEGPATKEEELKSLLLAVRATDVNLHQLFKFSSWGPFQQATRVPEDETGLALASISFVGTNTQRLDKAGV